MTDEPQKEGRPQELAEEADPDTPQDPGIPGRKPVQEQPTDWKPTASGRGFPEVAEDDDARRRATRADDTLPPGSMPTGRS
jgi:hypothetical protein